MYIYFKYFKYNFYLFLGVTHLPEIHQLDLSNLFQQTDENNSMISIVLATDGVWDNWTYEDVTKFVLDASCINAIKADPNGAKRVTLSFMTRNGVYAKRNFGTQADNATGIILYISKNNQMPSGAEFA